MAKVLLLSPPYVDLYGNLKSAAGRYFPLGIGYVASYLRDRGGHDVKMLEPEAQALSFEDVADIVKRFRPDVIGITCATPNYPRAVALAKLCKLHSPARIVLGGATRPRCPSSSWSGTRGSSTASWSARARRRCSSS